MFTGVSLQCYTYLLEYCSCTSKVRKPITVRKPINLRLSKMTYRYILIEITKLEIFLSDWLMCGLRCFCLEF
jgi:hypothetical protein